MKQKIEIKYTVTAFLLFCCIPPFFFWHGPFSAIAQGLFFLIALTEINKKEITVFRIVIMLLYIALAILDYGNFFSRIMKLLICPLFFCDSIAIKKIYDSFVKLFCFSLVLSLPSYILVVLLGIDLPHTTIEPLNALRTEKYVLYPFLLQVPSSLFTFNYRFLGMFDEPGVIGTFCGIFLLLDRFDFKNKRNLIFIIAGSFSMSLTFFLIIGIGVILYSPLKVKLIVIVLFSLALYFLYNNDIVYYYVFRRFEVVDGQFEGYNRTSQDFDNYFMKFLNSPKALWGLGAGSSAIADEGGASFKHIILDYGLLFFATYYLSFIIDCAFRVRNIHKLLIYVFCITCVLYQRPFITNISYVFLLFAPIVLMELEVKYNRKSVVKKTIKNEKA